MHTITILIIIFFIINYYCIRAVFVLLLYEKKKNNNNMMMTNDECLHIPHTTYHLSPTCNVHVTCMPVVYMHIINDPHQLDHAKTSFFLDL